MWEEVETVETFVVVCQYLKTGLVRKADLLHYMRKHKKTRFLPQTIVADIEDADDIAKLLADWRAVGLHDLA